MGKQRAPGVCPDARCSLQRIVPSNCLAMVYISAQVGALTLTDLVSTSNPNWEGGS